MSALVCDRRHPHGADCYTPPEGDAPVTAVDVDALDKLREAATGGAWARDGSDVGVRGVGTVADCWASAADAAYIVAMHAALPELIAAARERDALRDALEGLVRFVDDCTDSSSPSRAGVYRDIGRRLRAVVAAVDGGEQR